MTVEEIEIIVTAKVEQAIKEVSQLAVIIKQQMKQIQKAFSSIDTKAMENKMQQAMQSVKKKMQDFNRSIQNNEITIKVNNKEAEKQISQIQKQIDSLQEKINARHIQLKITSSKLGGITDKAEGGQEGKATEEIESYNRQLKNAKGKMAQLKQETAQTGNHQGKLGGFFSAFKEKLVQAKENAGRFKNAFKKLPELTQGIASGIKKVGSGLKNGIGHIFKNVAALFSLKNVYSLLSNSAQAWLSSQNSGAKQLSSNIEYMKYAMGSTFAPVIQWITNLVYQLMKAIQSVVYALFGVNIFANASAKSYASMAGNAKKAKEETKQLAGIHDEINSIQSSSSDNGSESGGTIAPSFDLSEIDHTPNRIIDAIKNGSWYEVGAIIGEKLNESMSNIPWGQIQESTRKIGRGIAENLNGFIGSTDWNLVGNTIAQGVNTAIYFSYEFVTTFDWNQLGESIGDTINGFFDNVDWSTAGKTLGEGTKGIFNTISTALQEVDWAKIGQDIMDFLTNIDWNGVISSLCSSLGAAIGGISEVLATILLEGLIYPISDFFVQKIEECGGNIILGLLKGIVEGLIGIGEWIYENMIQPFVEAFCNALGIQSPSTVFAEFGQNIIQGLLNGIQSLLEMVGQIWENIKGMAVIAFTAVKDFIVNIWNGIVQTISNVWNTIVTKVKEGVSGAWNAITSVFGGIADWFGGIFRNAWEAVKNVFSKGGEIFNGIKDGILNGLKAIVNVIITGINRVIAVPFNGINMALRAIRSVNILGMQPFSWIGTIGVPQIPTLAKGGVLFEDTIIRAGEYAGASTNPEIITPQNIMYDTMKRALSESQIENNKERPIRVQVSVGGKNLVDELIDGINEKTRQTGKAQIKVSYA